MFVTGGISVNGPDGVRSINNSPDRIIEMTKELDEFVVTLGAVCRVVGAGSLSTAVLSSGFEVLAPAISIWKISAPTHSLGAVKTTSKEIAPGLELVAYQISFEPALAPMIPSS